MATPNPQQAVRHQTYSKEAHTCSEGMCYPYYAFPEEMLNCSSSNNHQTGHYYLTIDQECVQDHAPLILPRIQYLVTDCMAVPNGGVVYADSVIYASTACAHDIVQASIVCLNRCNHRCIFTAGASVQGDLRSLSSA